MLIDTVRPRTAVIGEFGEELDGLEQAIVEAFQLEFDPLGVQVRPALLYEQHKLTA